MTACGTCGAENDPTGSACSSCGAALENPAAKVLLGQTVLGIYQLLEVVGKGGMSVVYKARHRLTEQLVALKILPAELAMHDDIKARFLEEARALARLEHPNIVRLYNFGEERGRFVLAMQYVEGTTFERQIFSSGRLDWRDAVGVVCQVLAALDYAHRRGIVHRDVKPSNILVRADKTATVMDFGIAKMAGGSTRLTATGQTMGTVRYMSPEQVRGKSLDARSDVYSVGATLYEALVGDTPYDGSTHFEIMMKHLHDPVPVLAGRTTSGEVPAHLDAVLQRALSKDPRARYPTAAAFLEELEGLLDKAGVAVPGTRGPREADPATMPYLPATPDGAGTVAPAEAREAAARAEANGTSDLPAARKPQGQPGAARRSRGKLALALGAVVAACAIGAVLLFGVFGVWGKTRSGPRPEAWPEPFLVGGLRPVVDRRFADVRVLAARDLDAVKVAASYRAAAARFTAWIAAHGGDGAVEQPPVNLIVAGPETMCEAELHQSPLPADCAARPPHFAYPPRRSTLYVLDDPQLEQVNLPEGVSAHLCINTPALLERRCMRNVLPPYWDEIERPAVTKP